MSSLSRRGILRDLASDFASVDLPVPGWPFIAIITGFCRILFDIFGDDDLKEKLF